MLIVVLSILTSLLRISVLSWIGPDSKTLDEIKQFWLAARAEAEVI